MTDELQISEREREILRLVATGASNQQIAQKLNISINTVKVHLRNIFGKIGVVSRTEATLYAVRSGLVSVERVGGATAVAEEPDEAAAVPVPQSAPAQAATPPTPAPPITTPPLVLPEPPAQPEPLAIAPLAPEPEVLPTPAAQLEPTTPTARPETQLAPQTSAPAAPQAAHRPALNPLVLALAAATLLAVGGLIATLLLRPAAPPAAPTEQAGVGVPEASERWRNLAPMPAPRAAFALASVTLASSNYLYVAGGEGPEGVTGELLRYDLGADSWARYSAKPTPAADVQAAVIGGRVYVPGGRTADGSISAALEAYDPQDDAWSTLAPMPAPRSRYALAAIEGKLYLLGGWDGSAYTGQVWQYSPDSDSWAELTSMAVPRADAGAAVIGGQIFLVGGENDGGPLARHDRYSPAEEGQGNPWAVRAPLPEPRTRLAAAAAYDQLFVIGGPAGALSYDGSLDSWQPVPLPEPLELSGLRAGFVGNNKLYILGGRGAEELSAEAYEYEALFVVTVPISRN